MTRKGKKWLACWIPDKEMEILEEFCANEQRTKTDVIRELIRTLDGALRSTTSGARERSR